MWIKDIHNKLNRIAFVVGGNYCSATMNIYLVESPASQYSALVDDAKLRAQEVYISTILPRVSDVPDTNDRIESLNAALLMMEGNGVKVINIGTYFKLDSCTINDGYFNDLVMNL